MSEAPADILEAAAQINQLIVDLRLATEHNGPRFDDFLLTSQQHAVLTLIISDPGITPRRLADRLGVTKSAISQHLAILEQGDYIERRRSEHDKRVQILLLRENGERYQKACMSSSDTPSTGTSPSCRLKIYPRSSPP